MKHQFEEPACTFCKANGQSIFTNLSQEDVEELSIEKSGSNFYKKGHHIFHEGNHPVGLYCIYKGKVKVYKLGDEGRDQIVRFAKEGDVLGYRSLISGETYSASATALEDSIICLIPKNVIFKYLEKSSQLSMEMMKLISHNLKTAENRLKDMTQKTVRERMVEALLMLKETFGVDDNEAIDISLTREELANIIGTTTESAIRLLSEMKKEGLLELQGRKIKILNMRALHRIVPSRD